MEYLLVILAFFAGVATRLAWVTYSPRVRAHLAAHRLSVLARLYASPVFARRRLDEESWKRYVRLREESDLLITALLPLLPLAGSWKAGYTVGPVNDPTVRALPSEWQEAAHHTARLHRLLEGLPLDDAPDPRPPVEVTA